MRTQDGTWRGEFLRALGYVERSLGVAELRPPQQQPCVQSCDQIFASGQWNSIGKRCGDASHSQSAPREMSPKARNSRVASRVPALLPFNFLRLLPFTYSLRRQGRGCGVGRGRGVGVCLGVGLGGGVGDADGVALGVGVGVPPPPTKLNLPMRVA